MLPIILVVATAVALFALFVIHRRRKSSIVGGSTALVAELGSTEAHQSSYEVPASRLLEAETEPECTTADKTLSVRRDAGSTDGCNVLIVDDQPMLRLMLREVLEASGLNVYEAASGEEALELAGSRVVDLMLLDMKMPGMDGVELLRRWRKQDGNPNADVSCAIISALDDPNKEREAIELGVTKFIVKPFDIFNVRDYVLDELQIRH
ncbi:response regulator [Paenibacillus xylaniclasticus]|uniref:response regulator n=1 Tax=Paenibacillus xylaniclasticus TaxID=588083 RepID=UPI0013DF26BC|nr:MULTISPECIES: response regulator [Paenibacillus]GFN32331.1 hypothetical protein PCURB6_25910 [Paenibacillus curdlanolyticus]